MSRRASGHTSLLAENPAGWPVDVLPILDRAITAQYASLTRAGVPIMAPVTPYVGEDGRTLDVSTGLTYPAKAERARRNPRVSLLYADPVGAGLAEPPVVLVQGLAAVRDSNLQANTDRYVRSSMAKLPAAYQGMPRFLLRRLPWYFARIWIQVTPTRMLWWPNGRLDVPPHEWTAPAGVVAPESDPAPPGSQPPPWAEQPVDWRGVAARAIAFDHRDLSWVDAAGFPITVPVGNVEQHAAGFRLQLASGLPRPPASPACLTFHTHDPAFTTQENHTFLGRLEPDAAGLLFVLDRLLADFSLAGNKLAQTIGFLAKGRRLGARTRAEAERRGQPEPRVRLPGE